MARIGAFVALALSVFAYVEVEGFINADAVKHAIVKREALVAAEAIRKITIGTPDSKAQIANMATDYVETLNLALYALSVAVPSSPVGPVRDHLAFGIDLFSNFTNDIQQAILGDSEQLKEVLAKSLEKLSAAAGEHNPEFQLAENRFSANQLIREHDAVIFGIYKLKFRALFFEKNLKELGSEISSDHSTVSDLVGGLKVDNTFIEEILRRHLRNMAVLAAQDVYRLENWIEVNPKSVENVKAVREVSEGMSDVYDKFIRAADVEHKTAYLNKKVLEIFGTVAKLGKSLTELNFTNEVGIQEFIRSVIFNIISAGHMYSENLPTFIATPLRDLNVN